MRCDLITVCAGFQSYVSPVIEEVASNSSTAAEINVSWGDSGVDDVDMGTSSVACKNNAESERVDYKNVSPIHGDRTFELPKDVFED